MNGIKGLLVILLLILISGCASIVTYPDGKQITFEKGFGVRNFEAKYVDKENKKEYSAKGDSNFKLPDLNLLSLPK